MKKIVFIILTFTLFSCSNFLKEYSKELVVVKTPTDLEEVMIGSGYLSSFELGASSFNLGQCGAFLNIMDDDVNTVIYFNSGISWNAMSRQLYGYTTWQYNVGTTWNKEKVSEEYTWNSAYASINTANIVLGELDRIGYSTEADRITATRVRGEAHFLRAQLYLTLVNIYGKAYVPSEAATTLGVPLKLSGYVEFDKETNGKFRRNTLDVVYKAIVEDLKASIKCLTESPQIRPLHRASAEAATLLLSRVYLYMQDWQNAKLYANQFLGYKKPLIDLPTYDGTFMSKDNREILFSQGTLNCQNMFKGTGGDFCVSSKLDTLYDKENDSRYLKFFIPERADSLGIGGKYNLSSHKSHVSDIFTIRTAEGYLNMAEACAMLGDPQANIYLNELRKFRIKSYVEQNYSGDELIRQVRNERRKELCFEGHRWFDIRRYAVCSKLPYSEEITRVFAVYDEENKNLFRFAEIYKLLPNSDAYTLPIPREVIEKEAPYMIDNPRSPNPYVEIVTIDFNDDDEEEM